MTWQINLLHQLVTDLWSFIERANGLNLSENLEVFSIFSPNLALTYIRYLLTDVVARIFSLPSYAVAGIRTHVSQ